MMIENIQLFQERLLHERGKLKQQDQMVARVLTGIFHISIDEIHKFEFLHVR